MKRILRLIHRRQTTLSYAARAFLRTVRTLAETQGPPFYYHVERNPINMLGQWVCVIRISSGWPPCSVVHSMTPKSQRRRLRG